MDAGPDNEAGRAGGAAAARAVGRHGRRWLGGVVRSGLKRAGYELVRPGAVSPLPVDLRPEAVAIWDRVAPYTLTSPERVAALVEAVGYVSRAGIPGAIVECGVWRGGSMLAAALALVAAGDTDRDLYLFDTFETMPRPGEHDVDVWGVDPADYFEAALAEPGYAWLPQEEVEELIRSSGYPPERIHLVRGLVEDTIPAHAPDTVALCRLDTDWYQSTDHEMRHLFHRIPPGGVLMVDDYGMFLGAQKAVDEYFAAEGLIVLLHRIDVTGRTVVVPGAAQPTAGRPPASPLP